MTFCSAKYCYRKGENIPNSEFEKDGRVYKQCSDCRQRQMAYKRHAQTGIHSKGFELRDTPVGGKPKFLMDGHKKMWQEWLRGLVAEVERCPTLK